MNPRVSRSSALASKATGYPIAKVAAKLAVGYTLDEIPNDLTGTTPASFEPTLDYVVVKFPRFAFEKFPGADTTLGTQMKSVGESMGIGRTFAEAFWKARAARSRPTLDPGPSGDPENLHPWFARASSSAARARRQASVGLPARRLLRGRGGGRLELLLLDPGRGATSGLPSRAGASSSSAPARTGSARGSSSTTAASTPRSRFRGLGYESVMVNCNPETVSTDYDTSDRLYFEPLDEESVLAVLEREQPVGVVHPVRRPDAAQARPCHRARRPSHPRDAVRRSRPRGGPRALRRRARAARDPLPGVGDGTSAVEAIEVAERIGYPVLVRPSYVLGGRAMRVCYRPDQIDAAFDHLVGPVLVDRFLEGALEIDVDALCDGEETYVAAVMQHVEEAGVHSGDSSCVLPPHVARPVARAGDPVRSSTGSRRRSASSA